MVVPNVVCSLFAGSRVPVHQTEKISPLKLLVNFLPYRRARRPYLHAAPKGGYGVGRTEARARRGGCRVLCCFRVLACSVKGKWAGGLTLQDCQRASFGVMMCRCVLSVLLGWGLTGKKDKTLPCEPPSSPLLSSVSPSVTWTVPP